MGTRKDEALENSKKIQNKDSNTMSSKKALVENLALVDAALHIVEQVPKTSLEVIEAKMSDLYPAKCSF